MKTHPAPIAPCLGLLFALAGCGQEPKKPSLVLHDVRATAQVVVFRARQGESKPIEPRDFRARVTKALGKARNVRLEEGAEGPSARLRVEAMLEVDVDAREGRAAVAMRTDRTDLPLTVTVVRQGRVRDERDESLLDQAVASATRALDGQARLLTADDRAVVAAIDDAEDDVRILAARLAAARRVKGAGAHVARMLASPRQEVRDAAIGALVELRDPTAVRPLIESARTDDPEAQLRIVEALAAIGGEEAAQYLELLASGSEEQNIRDAAERARERLAKRGHSPTP